MNERETRQTPLSRIQTWLGSSAGITILATVALAIIVTILNGPYIIVNTLVIGGMWALMAAGLALIFGVMNISSFAHGEYFMLGTLTAFYVFTPLHAIVERQPHTFLAFVAPLIAIFGAAVLGSLSGIVTDKLVFAKLRKHTKEDWVMNCFLVTLGLSVFLINAHQLIFGVVFKGIVRYWSLPPLSFFGVYISVDRFFAFLLAVVTIIIFWGFLKFSRIGRAIRAVSQDETGALMVGISVGVVHTLTMALSCGLAALAGATLIFMFPSYPNVGVVPLYNSWFIVLIAGLGNVAGAIAGGFIIALIQLVTRVYAGEGWEYVFPMFLVSAILVFKPNGIFGAEVKGIWER